MNDEQLLRYSRHLLLPELDIDGQQRLLGATVAVVGLGGLGSSAALYLAASGVGHLLLIDGDRVELSNLQRQIIHTTARIGEHKAVSAGVAIRCLNPELRVSTIAQRADMRLLDEIVPGLALLLDCSDNLATRYAINRVCLEHGRPWVSAAALRWEGQLAVFDPRDPLSPCYACLYPDQQASEDQSCAANGIAAPVVGMLGVLQALQAIKLIAGVGASLVGELVAFDGLALEWQRLRIARQSNCAVCADSV